MTPAEHLAVRTMIWASVGAAAGVPLLITPPTGQPLLPFTIHLAAMTGFVLALVFHLAPLSIDPGWFTGTSLGPGGRWALAAVWTVVLVTGATGLVALATAAALRFDPSLQFLSVLSAIDIAGVVAAVGLGARRRWGGSVGFALAAPIGVLCVWSMWRYLDAVGFSASGGWTVDGGEIARLVLPFDAVAVVIALAVFSAGARAAAAGRPTEQPRPRS